MTIEQLLRLLLQPDASPKIPADEFAGLVALAPTSGVERAVALGWRSRAAAVAGKYDLKADGNELSRSQVLAHCTAQAVEWEAAADAASAGTDSIASIVVSR